MQISLNDHDQNFFKELCKMQKIYQRLAQGRPKFSLRLSEKKLHILFLKNHWNDQKNVNFI